MMMTGNRLGSWSDIQNENVGENMCDDVDITSDGKDKINDNVDITSDGEEKIIIDE